MVAEDDDLPRLEETESPVCEVDVCLERGRIYLTHINPPLELSHRHDTPSTILVRYCLDSHEY